MQLVSNSKMFTSNVRSHCKWIQNVLNENCSQLGSRLAKIGTGWGSGERHSDRTALIVSSSQRSLSIPPFNVWSILMVSKMQNFMCKFPIISWKQHITMSMASAFLEVLRYSDAFWVSSQVLITCHDNFYNHTTYTKITQRQSPCFSKKQNSRHVHASSNHVQQHPVQSQHKNMIHDVSLRSSSNSKFWMTSRTLLSPSSLRDKTKQTLHKLYNFTYKS